MTGAEEDGEQGQSEKYLSSHSPLRISLEQCRTRPVTEAVSGKTVLIFPCVSSAGDAEQNDEQEQSQTNKTLLVVSCISSVGAAGYDDKQERSPARLSRRDASENPEEEQFCANLFPFFATSLP